MMNQIVSLRVLLCFAFFINISDLAAQAKPNNGSGVVMINGYMFEDSVKGIKKILQTAKVVENEFKPLLNEITKLQAEYTALEAKIKSTNSTDQKLFDQADRIRRDVTYKNEDLKTRYNKRYNQAMGPVYDAVSAAMNTWCKEKGYKALIDYSKFTDGVILWVDEQEVDVITSALIVYINSKVL